MGEVSLSGHLNPIMKYVHAEHFKIVSLFLWLHFIFVSISLDLVLHKINCIKLLFLFLSFYKTALEFPAKGELEQ